MGLTRELFFSEDINPSEFEEYFGQLHGESYRAFLDMLLFALPRPSRVDAPMLVLGAENDVVFPPADVLATAAAYDTTATIFPQMAHDMMLEREWQTVADAIVEWVQ